MRIVSRTRDQAGISTCSAANVTGKIEWRSIFRCQVGSLAAKYGSVLPGTNNVSYYLCFQGIILTKAIHIIKKTFNHNVFWNKIFTDVRTY